MNGESGNVGLSEAATRYLAGLTVEARSQAQQEVNRFVRWFGGERRLADLTAYEIEDYAGQLSPLATDYLNKIDIVRAFLVQARKKGWSGVNLAAYIKVKKGKNATPAASRRKSGQRLSLTPAGYDELKTELDELRKRRLKVIDDMRRAAEDKDFRENAPLQAAREERGHIEGRIMELEEMLKAAVIIDDASQDKQKVAVGDSIILREVDSGEEWHYRLVSPREVDPAKGKISHVSPVGRAVIGQSEGDVVEVSTPSGTMRCLIKQVS